jgi:hypothetical protein
MKLIDESVFDPAHVGIVLGNCPKLSKLHLHLKDYDQSDLDRI